MLKNSLLGEKTEYKETYSPELLFPVPRTLARDKIGLKGPLPFNGTDLWTGFELSWLNRKGKPEIALAEFIFPCTSPNVVESKSFKLYLNSFNQTHFHSVDEVQKTITEDLTKTADSPVIVKIFPLYHDHEFSIRNLKGECLDSVDVEIDTYQVNPSFLKTSENIVEEILYSDLLKSNCLATGQPDWGSVLVHYVGQKIDREGLLKYIISFRRHSGFAEHCVEEIFSNIMDKCKPEKLSVYARYTRRGGLDINPFRSNFEPAPENIRLLRQ